MTNGGLMWIKQKNMWAWFVPPLYGGIGIIIIVLPTLPSDVIEHAS